MKERDLQKAIDAGVGEWEAKKVRSIVACFDCGKRRCIFSRAKDEQYKEGLKKWQQKLESIDFRYTCVSDDDALSNVFAQRRNLRCSTPIERAYYMNKDRDFKAQDVCYYCGEGCREDDRSSDFLLRQQHLEMQNKTDGYAMFPICIQCLSIEKPVRIPRLKQNLQQAKKEREARKVAAAASKKSKRGSK